MPVQPSSLAWITPLALAAALLAGPSAAQQPAPPPAEVMVLGTYHFANPGLDVVKTVVADVMEPARQREIEGIVEALARFRPTRIAVERLPSSAGQLDSLYRAYRGGGHALTRDETQQLGFRLAAHLGHPRVYPIDHRGDFPFQEVVRYAQANDPGFLERMQRVLGEITEEENRRQRELSIAQNLRIRNEPERILRDHGFYMEFPAVGAGDGYVGAELLSRWYDRNIRIFANLRRVAQPGERVLVIIGSGHSAILRELIRASHDLRLVEAVDYLPTS